MLGAASTVTAFGLLTQLAGFLRILLIAAALGVSREVDAYNLGLILPSVVTTVAIGWLQTAYLGRYVRLLTQNADEPAAAYRGRMLTGLLVAMLAIAIPCSLFPAGLLAPLLPEAQVALAASVLGGVVWLVVPVAIADFCGLTLNGHGRFALAAVAPLVNAVVAVASLVLFAEIDLPALVISLLLGSIAQLLVVAPAYLRLPCGVRMGFGYADGLPAPEAPRADALVLPALLLMNAHPALIQMYAARLGEGAVAVFGYAARLNGAIGQLLVMGLSTVLLPHLARWWSQGAVQDVEGVYRRLARGATFVGVALVAAVLVLGEPIISVLFVRDSFDAASAVAVAEVWWVLTLSLLPMALTAFFAKSGQALGASGIFFAAALLGFLSLWAAAWLGASLRSLEAVVAASAVSFLTTALLWLFWLKQQMDIRSVVLDLLASLPRLALVLVPVFVVDALVADLLSAWQPLLALMVRGALMVGVGIAVAVLSGQHRWFLASDLSAGRGGPDQGATGAPRSDA